MDTVGPTHGVLHYWLSPALWEVATGIDDGLAFYGWDVIWDNEDIDRLKVRKVGVVDGREWSRYEPTHAESLELLTNVVGQHAMSVAVPYDATDEVALRVLRYVNSSHFYGQAQDAYHDRQGLGTFRAHRRLGTYLSHVDIGLPWCAVLRLFGRNGPGAFLTEEMAVRDAVYEACRGHTDAVRW